MNYSYSNSFNKNKNLNGMNKCKSFKIKPIPPVITLRSALNNNFSSSLYSGVSPPKRYYRNNNNYGNGLNYNYLYTEPKVDLGEIRMNFDIMHEKLNKLKCLMDDGVGSQSKNERGVPSYSGSRSTFNQFKSSSPKYNRINTTGYKEYVDYSGEMGRNVNINNFSYGNYENENTNSTSNLTTNNFNFEIKTPVKKQDKSLKHEKDGTSVNLSDIADDIVNALENDDDDLKTHVDDLKSSTEITLTLENNINTNNLKNSNKNKTQSCDYKISPSVVNISYEKEKKQDLKILDQIITEEKQDEEEQEETDNEDDLIIQEIMKKVQADNEKKQKHVVFNLDENIKINYKESNEITNFSLSKEKNNEKLHFTPRKMHLYIQILKSKGKPKSVIKPYKKEDLKINKNYQPRNLSKDFDEEESEGEGGNLINNIRQMFDNSKEQEEEEEATEEENEKRRQNSS